MRSTSRITLSLLACACAFAMLFGATPAQADDSINAKLHAAIDAMTAEQQAALLLLISTLGDGAAAAPAAAETAMGPMEALKTMLPKVIEAAKAENVDAIMDMLSKDFYQSDVGGKEDLRPFLENIIDMGYIEMYADEIEIITDDAELELDGDEASIYPIDIETPMGGVTVEILGKLEDGQWKVTGVEVY